MGSELTDGVRLALIAFGHAARRDGSVVTSFDAVESAILAFRDADREATCKVVCGWCAASGPPKLDALGVWRHTLPCEMDIVRRHWAKEGA